MYVQQLGYFLLVVLMAAISFFPSGVTLAKEKPLDVQLVSHQEHVGSGGTLSFHILYHNVTNKNISQEWLKVKVPNGLDVKGVTGAEWNVKERLLQWKVSNVKAKSAGVIHFNLKVKDNVKADTVFELFCDYGYDGNVKDITNKVYVRVGKEIHQPFFVGYPDGKFHPRSYLTRAETAAIIARIKNLKGSTSKQLYQDVPSDHWAYRYISQVTNAGYMNGNNRFFHPDDPISRAELVTLVLRLRGVRPVPLEGFTDTTKHWAGNFIATAKKLDFIDGINDKKFLPNGYTERQTAAKLISVALYRGPLVDGERKVVQHFPDVPRSHWSFGWVEEASMVAHESIRKGMGEEHLIRYLPDQTEPF
ncbi:S-layer homology domain-containing protein [Brevibacillus sp. SYP-B805]|uniref:S-layer homology domain-containing protein n=1 Tax=Brevibacillus sp. SYP-B805 TaxID=1578199 RepID=UPI0013EB4989|nr:S-layer homology domain-containing protein [Brevibacillus sp. SYP-B805]NGQ93980.1 S-layer homology domain-containing protein [Brevibacillus sp. SYP-B805]